MQAKNLWSTGAVNKLNLSDLSLSGSHISSHKETVVKVSTCFISYGHCDGVQYGYSYGGKYLCLKSPLISSPMDMVT